MGLHQLTQCEAHPDRIWSVAFSPDGSSILSASGDCTICLFSFNLTDSDTCTLSLSKRFHQHSRAVRRVIWHPDGEAFLSASFDRSLCFFYDLPNYTIERIEGHECEVKGIAFSHNGYLASCSRDRLVWVWEYNDMVDDFEVASVLHGHEQDVKNVCWHPTESLLASCSYDNTIRLWKDDDGLFVFDQVLEGHDDTVWSIEFSRCGNYLFSTGSDNRLFVWGRESEQWVKKLDFDLQIRHTAYELSIHPKFDLLAVAGGDHSITILNILNPLEPKLLVSRSNAHPSDVNTVHWHGEEKILVSGDDIGILKIWKLD
ncbi:hypothetical protein P9112_008352 [Eukaryota sp. TZLM1-RC]